MGGRPSASRPFPPQPQPIRPPTGPSPILPLVGESCECDKAEFSEKICRICYTSKPPLEQEVKVQIGPVLLKETDKCGHCGKDDIQRVCGGCNRKFCGSGECFELVQPSPMLPPLSWCKVCAFKFNERNRQIHATFVRDTNVRRTLYHWRFNRIRRRNIFPTLLALNILTPIIDLIYSYYSDIHRMEVMKDRRINTTIGDSFPWPPPGKPSWKDLTADEVKNGLEQMFEILPGELELYYEGRETKGTEIVIRGIPMAVMGRPFTVGDGQYSTSNILSTKTSVVADWSVLPSSICSMDISHYTSAQRQWLVEEWSRDGLAEHASIGSFSRHVLELLAVGAPSAIIAAAQSAIGDEIIHARLCFALASKFSNTPVEPDQFPIKTSTIDLRTTITSMAEGLVSEGCIEETISAICAFVMMNLYPKTDDAVFLIIQKIAKDEIRHAALSWKTLKWACDQGGKETQNKVRKLFEKHNCAENEGKELQSQVPYSDHEMLCMGRLPASLRKTINALTLNYLIQPWSEVILEGSFPQQDDILSTEEEIGGVKIEELVRLGANAIVGSWCQ